MFLRRPFFVSCACFVLGPLSAFAAAPSAPTNLTVTADGAYAVDLAWTDNAPDEAGFEIQYRVGTTGDFTSLDLRPPNEVSVHLTGTVPNQTYQFQIRSFNNANPVEYSGFAGPVTVVTPPAPNAVTSGSYRAGVVGQTFTYPVTSSNPPLATSYSISSLPDGLSMNPANGVITGTPTTSGKVTGTITITHSIGSPATAPLDIRIFKPLPALAAPELTVPLAWQFITPGTVPPAIVLTNHFSDPDVSTAARLTTVLGTMDFAFYPGTAPLTVANFLGYLERGDFANTMFHRSVSGFIVQGGAFRADDTASKVPTQPPVVNEPGITNVRGTVAMAKLGGDPDSATNQFFVNLADNGVNLDNQNEGFTVFARVAGAGMAVADAMAALPTKNFSSVNGALTNTPVRGTPPAVYDPSALVTVVSAGVVSPLQFDVKIADPDVATVSMVGADLQLTAVGPGETLVSVMATDLDNQSTSAFFAVTVNDTFDSWASRQNFPLPAAAASTADPDGDGRINLAEFALASSPLSASDSDPTVALVDGHLQLVFTLRQWMTGVTVTIQSSVDPAGPWTDEWKNTDALLHPWFFGSETGDGIRAITARDPAAYSSSGEARKFLRLKIDG